MATDTLSALQDNWNELEGEAVFRLSEVEGFPHEEFELQRGVYEEAERWFFGTALDDQPDRTNQKTDLYPLRINPLIATCLKHGYVLFGEVEDDGRPLVRPKLIPSNDEEKELAEQAEEILFRLWWESNGRAIMQENGILSQIYGGCVFKAAYTKGWDDWRTYPIAIERINPKGFIGYPSPGDMYRLSEAWIVKPILLSQAKLLGYTGRDKVVWYIEHWLQDKYTVQINDEKVKRVVNGKSRELGGENPFGFVPVIYIPHIRMGSFLGMNTFDHLKGLVKELNLRFADYGDAVNDDSHATIAMRNAMRAEVKKVGTREVIDLGTATGITGNEPDPDMYEVTTARASTSMKDLVSEIYAQYRRDAFVPAVADGEDEGSQRSGQTLAMRFWPLGQHVSMERAFWTVGMDVFQSYLLRMMAKINEGGITEEHTALRMKQKWAPILPRDREADVQEWVQRASADLASIDHLIELTGDVEDVEEQKRLILEWFEAKEDIKAKILSKYALIEIDAQGDEDMELQEQEAETQVEVAKLQPAQPFGGGGAQ